MRFQICLIVLRSLRTDIHFYLIGASRMFQVKCSGCIIGTLWHADLGFVPYPLHTIPKYLDLQALASLMSCSIFKTSTLCSASKNLTSRFFLDKGLPIRPLWRDIHSQKNIVCKSWKKKKAHQSLERLQTTASDRHAFTLLQLNQELLSQLVCSSWRKCSWRAPLAATAPRNETRMFPWRWPAKPS